MLVFNKSHSGALSDTKGFIRKKSGTFKNEKPVNFTRIDKYPSKCDCINGSIVNGIREPILYGVAHDKPQTGK